MGNSVQGRGLLSSWRVYPKIAARLRARIASGEYAPGELLPAEGALCEEFGISRNTVRRALADVEAEGLVITIPSKGRMVRVPDQLTREPYLYMALAKALREEITTGVLAPGAAMPSEDALQRRFNVSRATTRSAVQLLQREGVVVIGHGKRRFVAERPDSRRDRLPREPRLYRAVASTLRQEIAAGVPAPGMAMPSNAAIQRRFGVSWTTARSALRTLQREDLITVGTGNRWFVRQPDVHS
ncbi:GntR family transcriptional regulator [Acrocarpospora corrugata]|nr:GntR family transcriptional regulator [Acrocarpospora corrugata]